MSTVVAKHERMVWMDHLRGLSILLVIAFHGQTIAARFADYLPQELVVALAFFAPFRMPLLMFLSGMLLSRSLTKPPREFFGGKLRSIAWPYVLWSIPALAVMDNLSRNSLIGMFFLSSTYLWYLWFLFAFYVGAWIMARLNIPVWVGVAVGFVGAFGPDDFRISRFFFLLIFFMLGHFFVINSGRVFLEKSRPWLLPLSAAIFLAAGLASAIGVPVQYQPLFVLAPIGGIVLSLYLAPSTTIGPVRRALGYVGRDSIVFYVTHFVTMWVVMETLQSVGVTSPWVMYVVGVSLAVLTGVVFTWLRARSWIVATLFSFPVRSRPRARMSARAAGADHPS